MGVARLPAARRRAAVAGAARLRGPSVHLQVPGMLCLHYMHVHTTRGVRDNSELGWPKRLIRPNHLIVVGASGVPGDGVLLPRAVPGGHRRGPGEAGADAGRHLRERRGVARRRRALLQLRPLVDAHRLDAGVRTAKSIRDKLIIM